MHVAVVQHVDNNRDIHTPDYQGMRFSQHFQVLVLKQSGLPFIVDLLKFHNRVVVMQKYGIRHNRRDTETQSLIR